MARVEAGDELVLAEVKALCADLRGRPIEVHLDSDLRAELGLDSLAMVELVDRIGQAAGVDLGEDVLSSAATPRDLSRALQEATRRSETTTTAPEAPSGPVGAPTNGPAPVPPAVGGATVSTLNEALVLHAATRPDQLTIRLLGADKPAGGEEITYGALLTESQTLALALVDDGLSFGERVAIMLPTERAYFSVFFGILLAGGVPVPLYPPADPARLAEQLTRLAGVLRNAGAVALVTVPEAIAAARLLSVQVPSLTRVRTPAELLERRATGSLLPEVRPDDIALIQYTSGSTGDPKGVVLTHAQLLANMRAMAEAARLSSADVVVSWLPLYHDMGLIGLWHTPLVYGVPFVVMSPLSFLARPVRWLEAITAYSGTISAAPDFAYHACAERITDAELSGLDLSSWRLAFDGSEAVSAAVVDAFTKRFAPVGFRPEAMCPAYGLAEAGVGVAFSPLGRGPRVETVSRAVLARSGRAVLVPGDERSAVSIVGCGYPLPGYEIRIVGPGDRDLPERHEGRVLCRGPSLTDRYFANEAASAALWQHGWLDTGDLGYLADGELFLTGRAKDLIIRGGRNLHPEDLEAALRGVQGIEPDGVAAFSSSDVRLGTERLVVVAETSVGGAAERAALEDAIRRRAVDLFGLAPDEIVLVPPRSILRTASGKVRRAATRAALERGRLGKAPRPRPLQLAEEASSQLGPSARWIAGALATWAFGGIAWVVALLHAALLAAALQLPIPLRARWWLTRAAARSLSWVLGIPVDVDGTMPAEDVPAIVVANHPSFLDAVVLIVASASPLTFVTSTELRSKPVVGAFLERLGCAFVARGEPARAERDLETLTDLVRTGHRLVVFPEGSLARAPGVRPFHLGAFAVAATTRCPIVPVAIRGTRGVLPPGSYLARRGRVALAVGRPVDAPAADFAAEAALSEVVRRDIAQMAGLPLMGEPGTPTPAS
jgi:1-acyl-sn-glycerol-3-phosphate acyltransferase